jgi:anthraniloyl-CoA monooxygenase
LNRPLQIICVGGGPAGLYFAVLAKQADPRHEITVYERNRADDTFGFGVVFSDNTMGFLSEQDRRSYPEITAASRRWDPLTIIHRGQTIRCGGVGFSAIERKKLLNILQQQAAGVGVELRFQSEIEDVSSFADANLIVASDGVNSMIRHTLADHFRPSIELGATRFTWLGTTKAFDSLTFFFEESEHGVFGVHIYPYAEDRSTFIVETDEGTWQRAGMDTFSEQDTIGYCERLFGPYLDGHRLLSNRSLWQQFRTIRNVRWHHGNVVLMGDAAHTAHFSVGSGTKMAMEDALALSQALQRISNIPEALVEFEQERRPRVEHIQRMASASFEWWSTFGHYVHWPPAQFAFHCLTRSLFRYDTLRARDPGLLAQVEAEVGTENLRSRICAPVPPVRATEDGVPGKKHQQALCEAAALETGLILAGTAAVGPQGRISLTDAGLYTNGQAKAWGQILQSMRRTCRARIGIQVVHAGPRGATRDRDEGLDEPLDDQAWPLLAASPLAYLPHGQVPRQMETDDFDMITKCFAAAAGRALEADFDWLELHFGHGYLIGTFISPLTNVRQDSFGGDVKSRMRFPLDVLDAVRAIWPRDRLLAVAISATDWVAGRRSSPGGRSSTDGTTSEEAMEIARLLAAHGCDLVTVLGGQTVARSVPAYGRCFQMLPAGRIRNEAKVPTMAVGGITDLDDIKTVLLSGRADYCRVDHARLGGL